MNFIVAVDKEWNIGCQGKLLTYIPEDLKYFKSKTLNKVVIMGRKTLESLPGKQPLVDRVNIVLTRDKDYKAEGTILCHSIEELINTLATYDTNDVFVIGGAEIYKTLMPYCKKAYITKIDNSFEADTHIPNLDLLENWELIKDDKWNISNKGPVFKWIVYNNKNILSVENNSNI